MQSLPWVASCKISVSVTVEGYWISGVNGQSHSQRKSEARDSVTSPGDIF